MKGCLIALAVVLLIIVLIVVGLGVYFFAFEKDVPDFVIDYIKEGFAGLSEAEINRFWNNNLKLEINDGRKLIGLPETA